IDFVMLHVNCIVIRLSKATSDRLSDSKQSIKQLQAEEWVMNEVVPYAVDVCVDHQRVNESNNQHHPKRRIRKQQKQTYQIEEMEKTGQRRNRISPPLSEQHRPG